MQKLQQIFGVVVPTFFADKGMSLSQINRIQAEHKQQNDKFWATMDDGASGVFKQAVAFVGGVNSAPQTFEGLRITSGDIKGYAGVAERNAQIAILMHALKLHKRLDAELQQMDLRLHVVASLPIAPPRPIAPKRGSTCHADQFMEMANIDEMIGVLNPDVMAKFDLAFWNKANELNSRAAALGKLISEKDAFFRQLVRPVPKGSSQPTQNGVIFTTWQRAYSIDEIAEFSRLRDELQAEYNGLQQQLNGCRKQIKDAVRAYNLDAERRYQLAYGAYQVVAAEHDREMERIRSAAETLRQEAASELAALRVRVE